jgi:acyl-CoA thioester hydrolase
MPSESRLRVRYRETDQMAIAHHGNYLTWFEVGRTDLCRELGWTYRAIEESGYLLVVTEVGCKYRIPFGYDELVRVVTSVDSASRRMIRFRYELLDEAGVLHADGFSAHIWVSRETRRPVTAPTEVAAAFVAAMT